MKTALKNIKIVKIPVKNFPEKESSYDKKNLPKDLIEAIEDVRLNRNLYGPFENAEDAIKSMLEN
jgi:hypothetical protein